MIRAVLLIGSSVALLAAEPPQWTAHSGYRAFPVAPPDGAPGFTPVPAQASRIAFTNFLSERSVAVNRVTENGSGVALGDVDGDGWCDIYLCGLERENALYRNLGGWKFQDMTAEAGVACPNQLSTGAALADVDGDGDLDLLVNSIGGGTRLFLNDGRGKFAERTGSRLVRRFGSTSLALGDIDQDGDLDLYVANYRTMVFKDELPQPKVEAQLRNGQIVVTPPGRFDALRAPGGNAELFERAERDFLYVNDGKGYFSPVSWTNGNFLNEAGQKLGQTPLDWALSVMIRDLDGDSLADIVTCNDFFHSPDRIWLQQPGHRFQAIAPAAWRKVSLASMAVDVADLDRDGDDDLFFAEMLSRSLQFRQTHRDNAMKAYLNTMAESPPARPETPRNTLFLNRGDGTYAEAAELAGLDASEWSWGAVFLDVDLDGWEDLLIPTGHHHDVQDADILRAISQARRPDSIPQRIADLARFAPLRTPMLAFRNGGALRFSEMQDRWGLGTPGVVHGLACADLDLDGDLDLVGNRLNDGALLLRNDTPGPRIAIRLQGLAPNTRGIGAKIIVRGGPVVQQQTIMAGGRYLSSDDPARTFAAGAGPLSVEVRWPNRTVTVLSNVAPNQVCEIIQPAQGQRAQPPDGPGPEPLFAEVSGQLGHRDAATGFDDFARQPLLRYSLATPGPSLAWADLDDDGSDELLIGANRGQTTQIFKRGPGGFQSIASPYAGGASADPQGSIVAARLGSGAPGVLVALSNYESASARTPSLEARGETQTARLPGARSTAGALALSDLDGDGDLDLFVAGRVLPGRYPAAASSRVFRNERGELREDERLGQPLANLGLVSGAAFADLDGDGADELIAALEWGGIRIWKVERGEFVPVDAGLGGLRGLWTGIAVADFDGDGRLDFTVGNWGRNTRYQRYLEHPIRLHAGDLDGNGAHDLIEAVYDPGRESYFPLASLDLLQQAAPALAEQFGSYRKFSETTAAILLSDRQTDPVLEITTLDSICFLNRGNRFEARPLPLEAQLAPVFGCASADFDGDGLEDLVLAQNLFDTHWEMGRLDSGLPLFLRGNGRGDFEAIGPSRSGLHAAGQQRAVALCDFNRDGRVDVAVSQHNDATKLFENRSTERGLRLRFRGDNANPDAIGARYRILEENGAGPVRQLQAGSGWLSQHSLAQVVRRPSASARLEVTWPGGRQSVVAIPPGAGEVLVTAQGIGTIEPIR